MSTGEFRAAPDVSANTAQFQAFADSRPPSGQWSTPAPAPNPRRMTGLVIAIVVAVLIVVALIIAFA